MIASLCLGRVGRTLLASEKNVTLRKSKNLKYVVVPIFNWLPLDLLVSVERLNNNGLQLQMACKVQICWGSYFSI